MTASVRAGLLANLLAMLGTLSGDFPGLEVERNRPEGEAVDRRPHLGLIDDERAGADEVIDRDVYVHTCLAQPVIVGWVEAADRAAALAEADRLAVAVARLVGAPGASLGPGWVDTEARPAMPGGAAAAVEAIASFQLPLAITYQHAATDPADPATGI
ncbi:MAG: hypothetical protein J0H82_04540 [Alphaproteobacteria bacterium]|jgi:hypothetical protein|nr:hypothetical protein [Alphaproteobacteria bacterium]